MPSDGEKELWTKRGFLAGDEVVAVGRDYRFTGIVIGHVWKLNGKMRFVAENDDGIMDIFALHELVKVSFENPTPDLQEKGERVKRERK